ncbi:ribonuclease H1 domain-containing protein [Anaerococcus provencensis]|uniref:ribonuclease H1 domain-containing protein n=1 Tax=Anaerococcus provencensis TaxID=938293 RepID=UPI0005CAEDEC|nr:ribonuclease H family protein [Anaerococcus provencensis]
MKYYAVKKGRNPGIYTSWDSCLKEVKGYSGAIYKSFKTKEEAEIYMAGEKKELEIGANSVIAYVDGSYNQKLKVYGSGVVYITDDKELELMKSYDDSYHIHRNVAGEVKASELAIEKAIEDKKDQIIIYHDYQGIASWANGDWKTNNDLTKAYKSFIDQARKKIKIDFVKVKGHSNDKYNDKADQLAKEAAGIG